MKQYSNDADRSNEAKRRNVVEKMWLHYYNNTLLEMGLITQSQFRRMQAQINCRKPSGKQ